MSATHCDQHQQAFVWKPAGISKRTGQPYNAFQACPVMGCRERPAKANGGFLAAPQAPLEPRTGPSAPAPLPGASGGLGRAQNSPERDRLIVAQVSVKAAIEFLSGAVSNEDGTTATEDQILTLSDTLYRHIFRLAAMDPNDTEGLGF